MIRPITGAMWAAQILYGQKPFPTYKPEKPTGDFQKILDEEMEKLNERDDMGRSNDKIRNGQNV